MSTPFLAEIKIVSFNFPPKGWAYCNGQFLPINQNQALFALLGTTYGGNGQTNFALPDFRGRVPIHRGNGFTIGQRGGAEAVTLNIQNLPTHIHGVQALNAAGDQPAPAGNFWAGSNLNQYRTAAPDAIMSAKCISSVGGSQPHENRMPYLVLNFIIALQGIFPSPN